MRAVHDHPRPVRVAPAVPRVGDGPFPVAFEYSILVPYAASNTVCGVVSAPNWVERVLYRHVEVIAMRSLLAQIYAVNAPLNGSASISCARRSRRARTFSTARRFDRTRSWSEGWVTWRLRTALNGRQP